MAKGHDVAGIEPQIRPVAHFAEVVRLGCRGHAPTREAIDTQRVPGQERCPETPPTVVVAASGRGAASQVSVAPRAVWSAKVGFVDWRPARHRIPRERWPRESAV